MKGDANLFGAEYEVKSIFDQLLTQSRTYSEGRSFRELLEFTVRMPQFAPFNAMLLHIQRPGLTFATSGRDWLVEFRRHPKRDARPLLILRPFAPVVFVYDVLDTDGADLPEGIYNFYARGNIGNRELGAMLLNLERRGIEVTRIEAGDSMAGSIGPTGAEPRKYALRLNMKHELATQFVTIAHELGHLYLGHLDADEPRRIPDRSWLTHWDDEIEAELVAYLVARRTGIESASEGYLSNFLDESEPLPQFELFQILRAAGQVESALGLTRKLQFTTCENA